MVGLEKKTYIAKVGLDFDGLKGKPRVEAGDPIPDVSEKEIAQLLKDDQIEELKPKKTKEPEQWQ